MTRMKITLLALITLISGCSVSNLPGGPAGGNNGGSLYFTEATNFWNDENIIPDKTIYIATNGNDTTGDGSSTNPYATLVQAVAVVQPGEMIYVKAGTYYPASEMEFHKQGQPGKPIIISGDTNAVFDGSLMTSGRDIIHLSRYLDDGQEMYWIIQNIKLLHAPRAGMRLNHVDYVTVRDVEAGYNQTWGIFAGFSSYLHFIRVNAHHSAAQHGIYISNSGDNHIIEFCVVYENAGCGIHHNGDASMGGDGIITNSTIRNNVIYGNGALGGGAINMDGVMYSKIYNNLVYSNRSSGITTFIIDGACSGSNVIVNNTVYCTPSEGRYCLVMKGSVDGDGNIVTANTGNIIANNIFISGANCCIENNAAGTNQQMVDYNAYYRPSGSWFSYETEGVFYDFTGWKNRFSFDAHSIALGSASDVFQDIGSFDFRAKTGSPTIDAGWTYFAISKDLTNNARLAGNQVDMGAFEY